VANVLISTETVAVTDQEYILTYAKTVRDNLSIGGDLRLLAHSISKDVPGYSGARGSGAALNLGLKYVIDQRLSLGLALQDLGGRINYLNNRADDFPTNVVVGSTWRLPQYNSLINLDFSKEGAQNILLHLGGEWQPIKYFAARLGLDQTPKNAGENYNNITFGIGTNLAGITFDYALYHNADSAIADSHLFSFGYVGQEKPSTVAATTELTLKHFSDVPEGYWAREPIEKLTALGLLNWYTDGTFRPEQPISRAETVNFLVRAKDLPRPKEPIQVFPDVPLSFWAAESIQLAYDHKLTIGYPDGDFKPRNNTTRAEAATFLARFDKLKLKTTKEQPFPDLSTAHWAIREVLAAKEEGLLDYLKDNPFQPAQSLTRAELAEVLYRTKLIRERVASSSTL
jgi:hypothetical protein